MVNEFRTNELERDAARLLTSLPVTMPAPAFMARLHAAVQVEAARQRTAVRGLRGWRWAVAVAAAVALMAGVRIERNFVSPPESEVAAAERQLDAWSDAFATLVTEVEVTAPLRLDEESLDQVVNSINEGLSLGS